MSIFGFTENARVGVSREDFRYFVTIFFRIHVQKPGNSM